MNSEDATFSSFLAATLVGCFSAFVFALFIVLCKQFLQQIKKKDKFLGFVIAHEKRKQRIDSTFENYEYCNCCCKDQQIPCNCGCNSNNNSNSLSQDQEEDSNNALIFDRNSQKQNESLLDAISVEKGINLSKVNYCQNSLDVASLDEIVNEDLFIEELDKNVSFELDENDNQSFEIIKKEEDNENSAKQLNNDKSIKVILKLHKNLSMKLHSQSIELINEKPSTKSQKFIPLLRRASLNIAGLVRQKSFDCSFEEDGSGDVACQEFHSTKDNIKDNTKDNKKDNSKNNSKNNAKNNSKDSTRIRINNFKDNKKFNSELVKEFNLDNRQSKSNLNDKNKLIENKFQSNLNDRMEANRPNDNSSQNKLQAMSESFDSSSEDNRTDYKGEDYKTIWDLRATLEAEVDKDLNDSCGDLSEISNLTKQQSIENTEEHELIKNVSLSSNDQKSSIDSGYKSIERRDYSIDSKTECIYRQFTNGSSSLSKEFSLGSISNQNISLCSSNSINLDVKNYKNQYSIKEEREEDTNEQKITFV